MAFTLSNGVITQTGTDNNLAGLAGLTGVTVMSNLTNGITKRIVNIGTGQLVIAGTLNQNTATDTLVLDSAAVPIDGTGGRIRVINGGKWTAYSTASRNGVEFYRKSPALISNQYQDHYLALLVNVESGAAIDWKNVSLTSHSAVYQFSNGSKIDIDNTDLINISASGNSGNVRMMSCDARINNLRLNCMPFTLMSRDKNNIINNILPSGSRYGLDFSGNSSSAANDLGFYPVNNYSHDPSNDYAYRFWGQYARVINCEQGSDIKINIGELAHRGLMLFYRQLRADAYLNGTAVNDGTVYVEDYNNGSRTNFIGSSFTVGLEGAHQDFRTDRDFFGTTGTTGEVLLAVLGKFYGAANPIILDYRTKNGNNTDVNDVHILKYECDYDTVSSQSFKGTGELVLTRFLKADANITLAKADALALLGTKISVDTTTDTVKVLQNITLNDLYDACKAYKTSADKAKIKYKGIGALLFTASGGTLNTTLNIVVNTGAVISAGSKFDTLITTGTVTNSGDITCNFADSTKTQVSVINLNPNNFVFNETYPASVMYRRTGDTAWLRQSAATGTSVKFGADKNTSYEIRVRVPGYGWKQFTVNTGNTGITLNTDLTPDKTLDGVNRWTQTADPVQMAMIAFDPLTNRITLTNTTGVRANIGLTSAYRRFAEIIHAPGLAEILEYNIYVNSQGTGFIIPDGNPTHIYLSENSTAGVFLEFLVQFADGSHALDRFHGANGHQIGITTQVNQLSVSIPSKEEIKAAVEGSAVLAKEATLSAVKTDTDKLGATVGADGKFTADALSNAPVSTGGSGGATPAEIWAHPERTLTVPAGLSPQQEAVLAEIRTNTQNTADAVAGEGVNIPHETYAEPFCGAAHVFFRKPKSKNEVLNDINQELINFYRVLKNHPETLYRETDSTIGIQAVFQQWEKGDPDIMLTDIQRAVRFYYLQRWSYGGRVYKRCMGGGPERTRRINYQTLKNDIETGFRRIQYTHILNTDYQTFIRKNDRPDTLFYCDPPYYDAEDYYGKNIFSRDDFSALRTIFDGIKGTFLMSINDRPEIRDIFSGFYMREVQVKYSVFYAGDRTRNFAELLISNSPSVQQT
ncbi:hypothetical protein CHS0354_006819 [Potamilus streckersoni]|uniref:site-specific DNA-methyltransferase (adenine-specific) n=1 Tax=Potamilus streckersoni TaxID=2493646 RepID=A0AAE0TF61_9BIVA|nr:hypothetical protein CHS0354_006819 [Potamilus streckersoni]